MPDQTNQDHESPGMRPSTIMDRIFDVPLLYRAKVSLVRIAVRPLVVLLMHNRFSVDELLLQNIGDGARVYEIGCGDGNTFRLLEKEHRGIQYTGSDFNTSMVAYCQRHYPGGRWEEYHGGKYPHADGSFDFCVIRNVLHHISTREEIVATVREAVRMARVAIIFEPLQSENFALAGLKSIYWRLTDGGANYMRLSELHEVWRAAQACVQWEIATEPLRQVYACALAPK